MTTRPPAEIGMSLDEVDTPALVIDLDAFERNLRRPIVFFRDFNPGIWISRVAHTKFSLESQFPRRRNRLWLTRF